MLPDVLFGGVKKFGDLVLVHPDHAVSGVQGNRGFAVNCVVDDDVFCRRLFCLFRSQTEEPGKGFSNFLSPGLSAAT